jgi:uncharacterized membrane protein YgcG
MIRISRCLLLLFLIGCSLPLWAAERILDFDSDIVVLASGNIDVTETIRVQAEGSDIRRGIYRDIPTDYQDRFGNRFHSDLELLSVMRDGHSEDYHTEGRSNGLRIYIGNANRYLKNGIYEYRIRYRMQRQLGFFEDHDELYWNVTGNGWIFPIDHITASVSLPNVPANVIGTEAYTGPEGAKGQDYISRIDPDGVARFESTRALPAHQGMTIVVTWPKGYVHEPDAGEKIGYLLRDNRSLLIGLGGLSILLLYYLLAWYRAGRDPEAGVIFPLYQPPKGYSPASMRFIRRMAYDHKCLASAIINLAVKGYLSIDDQGDARWVLKKTGKEVEMAAGEAALVKHLFKDGDSITLKQSNHQTIAKAVKAQKRSLRANYESTYFENNRGYLVPGILISIVLIAAAVLAQKDPQALEISAFMSIWLSGWSAGTFALVYSAWHAWRSALNGGGYAQAISLSLFSLPFVGFWFFGAGMLASSTGLGFMITLVATVAINILFYQWLKAPTLAGRRLLDKIEGFREYLNVAEADEMAGRKELRDLKLFEQFLPYAIALDVEQAWADRFAGALARINTGDKAYRPSWYHGSRWSSVSPAGFATALGSGLSTAIASSSRAPGSSSGSGGGGSSGGGGGGGGGGGW